MANGDSARYNQYSTHQMPSQRRINIGSMCCVGETNQDGSGLDLGHQQKLSNVSNSLLSPLTDIIYLLFSFIYYVLAKL